MKSQTKRLRNQAWARDMAERVRTTVNLLNDEYNYPIGRGFRYPISGDLLTFLVDLKRLEAIRRELLKSEKVRDPNPKPFSQGWPEHRVLHEGPENRAWPKLTFRDAVLEPLNDEGRQIMHRLNTFLTRFQTYPRLYSYRLTSIATARTWPRDRAEERILGTSVEQILRLLKDRLLHRLRNCTEPHCKRWFIAITEHQQYCATACRIRHVAQSESFKEKRARYMRERYRPQIKQMEERAKRSVARKKG